MATVRIDLLGLEDFELIANLYNQVFKPARDIAFFQRRYASRQNPLIMVAIVEDQPVGFSLGFELKPSVCFLWLYGVMADYRRAGIASQLMEACTAWAKQAGYTSVRMECQNHHRPMLHLGIKQRFDIVGIRWDPDRGENLVIFEKIVTD